MSILVMNQSDEQTGLSGIRSGSMGVVVRLQAILNLIPQCTSHHRIMLPRIGRSFVRYFSNIKSILEDSVESSARIGNPTNLPAGGTRAFSLMV